MIGNKVWHKEFGFGLVIGNFDRYVLIKFDNFEEKKISHSVWGTVLFNSMQEFSFGNKGNSHNQDLCPNKNSNKNQSIDLRK